jgi:hypothetical protein
MNPQTPAGWYPDPGGSRQQRYFDGNQWTEHFAGGQQPPPPQNKKSRTGWIVAGALGGVLLVLIIAGIAGTPSDEESAQPSVPASSTAAMPALPSLPAQTASPAPTFDQPTTINKQITYEVHSDGPLMTVSYFDELNNMTQVSDQPADWSTSFTGKATYQMHSMSAQTKGEQVSCKITVDGTVVASDTASGRYAVVVCSG